MASVQQPTPRELRWRARNPELAARFDRLPAGAKHNIRTANFERGTARLVRSADEVRREAVRERSRERRAAAKLREDVLARRREVQVERIAHYYGLGPEKIANLRHNIVDATPIQLRRMEEADVPTLRRLVAAQLPDGATNVFHYNSRRG